MVLVDETYTVQMGFTPRSAAVPDPDRPPLLRAPTRTTSGDDDEGIEVHRCRAVDLTGDDTVPVDLLKFGFDTVDLTSHDRLQAVLSDVRHRERITDPGAAAIRAALDGAVLQCSNGRSLTVLYVADEGLIMRTAGPNRMTLVGERMAGMNGHGPATSVHTDQDVYGTPLVKLMDGRAPDLFRHDSPDGSNDHAPLMLVNLWIPLQQIVQPLVLADGRSVDRPREQLRYGLPTDSFLDRDDDQVVNDIWTYVHDPGQRWYFSSDMDQRSAYVFNTLSCPHGAGTLAGEDVAQNCYLALLEAETAIENGDPDAARTACAEAAQLGAPEEAPPVLRAAIADMVEQMRRIDEAAAGLGDAVDQWLEASREARQRVVRMSLEMRIVVSTDA